MKTQEAPFLILFFLLIFLSSCGKDDGIEYGKTYIRGQLLEYGSEVPLPNVAMYLQDCDGELFGPTICTTIDTFYTDVNGEYDYEFVHSPSGSYICWFEQIEGYYKIRELVLNHGLNERVRHADPYGWLNLRLKNINPINQDDKIRFTYEYKPGSWEDIYGNNIDSSFLWRVKGNYEGYLLWKVTKEQVTTEFRDSVFVTAHDTTFHEILY